MLSGVNLKGAYILVHINSFRLGQTNSEYYIVWSRCVMVLVLDQVKRAYFQMKRVLFSLRMLSWLVLVIDYLFFVQVELICYQVFRQDISLFLVHIVIQV